MLVLTRREQESIQIGNDVTIWVIKVRGNRVRLGVEAPLRIPVRREELPATELPAAFAGHPLDSVPAGSEQPATP